MRRMLAVALAGLTAAGLIGIAGPAHAAFPSTNGRIVFDTSFSHRPQIFTIRPDRGPVVGGRAHPLAPRALGSPVHTHRHEDEYSVVLEGVVGAEVGGRLSSRRRGLCW
jgi:hypothetical protein